MTIKYSALVYSLAAAAAALWFLILASMTYDFRNPVAAALVQNNLSHLGLILTHLPRNLALVLPVLVFIVGGIGPGSLVLRGLKLRPDDLPEWLVFSLGLGLIVETFATLTVGVVGLLSRPVLYILLGFSVAVTIDQAYRFVRSPGIQGRGKTLFRSRWESAIACILGLVILINLYFALLGALMPEVQFDARLYHLAEAKRYAEHHGFFNAVKQLGIGRFGWPHYQEILYSGVAALWGIGAAKVLSWANALLAALFSIIFGRRFFHSTVLGLLAAAFFVSTPVLDWSASTASNDLSLAPFTLLAFYGFLRWRAAGDEWQWPFVTGALCGYTLGLKPFAIFNIVALLLLMVLLHIAGRWVNASERRPNVRRDVAVFCAAVFVCYLPSMLIAFKDTGNPVFPFANGLFHSPDWTPAMDTVVKGSYTTYGADTSFTALFSFPWASLIHSDQYRNIVGPLFLFALPIVAIVACVKRWGDPLLRLALAYIVCFSLLWFTSGAIEPRYSEAIWPLACIVIADCFLLRFATAAGHRILRATLATIAGLTLLLNFQPFVPLQKHAMLPYVSGSEVLDWAYLYQREPERNIQLRYVPMIEFINSTLHADRDKVYDDADGVLFNVYSDVDLFNGNQYDGPTWTLKSPDAYQHLKQANIDYVLVFDSRIAELKDTALWAHLKPAHHTDPSPLYAGRSGFGERLFRVQ